MKPRHESEDYSIPKVKLGGSCPLKAPVEMHLMVTGKLTDPSKCHK